MLSVVVDGLIEVVGDDDDGGILLIGIEKETFFGYSLTYLLVVFSSRGDLGLDGRRNFVS